MVDRLYLDIKLKSVQIKNMENSSYYEKLLHERYKDIATISTVLILIGVVIGIIGNSAIIVIYWFRIKERGERYFLPLLATVDLTACVTSSSFYIMDNTYFYAYPNDGICIILTFLQVCVPGISAHALLVISVQRYMLVCKPHSPRMSLKCKRISFFVAGLFAFTYSCPLLGISGIQETKQLFMNNTVRTSICRFSIYESSMINIYFGLLALITIANLVVTISLFVPIMRKINIVLGGFSVKMKKNCEEHSQTSGITSSTDIEPKPCKIDDKLTDNEEICCEPKYESTTPSNSFEKSDARTTNDIKFEINEEPRGKRTESYPNEPESGQRTVKKRITIMFFVITLVYVVSYIPSMAILVLTYAIEDFSFIKLTRSETAAWTFLARFVFLNHIANPIICGYFDVKFKNELSKLLSQIFKQCK